MSRTWLAEWLACPRCHGDLEEGDSHYSCADCRLQYPFRFGIPDFRLRPDPYISVEDEVRKIEWLTSVPGLGFSGMLLHYYHLSPENPPHLHQRYVAAMEAAVERATGLLERLRARFPDGGGSSLLDLGCGTAGLTAAAAGRYRRVVGVDIALRWLVLGRQRLREHGVDAPLLCANAEELPFKPGVFDAVVGDAVLEHARRPQLLRDELIRVLAPDGVFLLTTNNRYSILPEPHLRIWGFGLIPRRWMEAAAWRLRKTPYKARLLSRRETGAVFRELGQVELPEFRESELPSHARRLFRFWRMARRLPFVPRLIRNFAPLYFVFGKCGKNQRGPVA